MNAQGVVQAQAGPPIGRETSLLDHLEMVIRRKIPFLVIASIVVTVTFGLAFGLPPVYRSTAVISIEQQEIPEELVKSTITAYADQRIQQISRRILSRDNLLGMIQKYDLYREYRERFSEGEIVERMKENIRFAMSKSEVLKGSRSKRNAPNIAFTVSFEYPKDPEIAQKVTRDIVNLFLEENKTDRQKTSEGISVFLLDELHRLQAEAGKIDLKMANFKRENSGLLPDQVDMALRVSDRLDSNLAETERKIFDLKQQNIILRSDLSKVSKYVDAPNLRNDLGEQVMSAEGRIQVLKSTYVTLLSKYSTAHPKMKKIENEIVSLGGDLGFSGAVESVYSELSGKEKALVDMRATYPPDAPDIVTLEDQVRRLKSRIGVLAESRTVAEHPFNQDVNPAYLSMTTQLKVNDVEIRSLERKKQQYRAKQASIERDMVKSPMVEMRYKQLSREYEVVLAKVRSIQGKLNTAEMSEKLESSQNAESFTLVEAPQVPVSPVKPNRKKMLLLGLLLAPGLGFVVSYLVELFDKTIFSQKIITQVTGEKPLSVIPFMSGAPGEGVGQRLGVIKSMPVLMPLLLLMVGTLLLVLDVVSLNSIWDVFVNQLQLLVF